MKYFEIILKQKKGLFSMFLLMGTVIMYFTDVSFLNFVIAFFIATLLAFYIEYNDNKSKIMLFFRKWF